MKAHAFAEVGVVALHSAWRKSLGTSSLMCRVVHPWPMTWLFKLRCQPDLGLLLKPTRLVKKHPPTGLELTPGATAPVTTADQCESRISRGEARHRQSLAEYAAAWH
jgi:hypothetical protein